MFAQGRELKPRRLPSLRAWSALYNFYMREVTYKPSIKRDLKKIKRRGKELAKLLLIVELLAKNGSLPNQLHPHKLSGKYDGLWECHIEHDWLLIYDVEPAEILLFHTGSHSDLFE